MCIGNLGLKYFDLGPPPSDLTVENLLPVLRGMASKWQSLGKALSLDEDILDEIYTNNETDEDCLRDMLEWYLMRSDSKRNWEEIDEALRRVKDVPQFIDGSTPSTAGKYNYFTHTV